jgi:hypothetical protein
MKYLTFLFWLCLAVMMFYLYVKEKRKNDLISVQKIQINSLQKAVDSLNMENYPCQIELGRYERAYHIFTKRNPKAAKEYAAIISDETE